MAGTIIGEESTSFGVLYAVTTFGTRDKNLSVDLGWGFADGEIASTPTISVSGMIRTGPRGYLISENHYIGTADEFVAMLSLGGRRIIKNVGLDFGAFVPVGDGGRYVCCNTMVGRQCSVWETIKLDSQL